MGRGGQPGKRERALVLQLLTFVIICRGYETVCSSKDMTVHFFSSYKTSKQNFENMVKEALLSNAA